VATTEMIVNRILIPGNYVGESNLLSRNDAVDALAFGIGAILPRSHGLSEW